MELNSIFFILLIHFLADFGLQTEEQATNKSTDIIPLFKHVAVYSSIWFIGGLIIFFGYANCFLLSLILSLITFIIHFFTDYITSRITNKFFDKKDYHNGFVTIGFDQLLHYLQLILTIKLLLTYG